MKPTWSNLKNMMLSEKNINCMHAMFATMKARVHIDYDGKGVWKVKTVDVAIKLYVYNIKERSGWRGNGTQCSRTLCISPSTVPSLTEGLPRAQQLPAHPPHQGCLFFILQSHHLLWEDFPVPRPSLASSVFLQQPASPPFARLAPFLACSSQKTLEGTAASSPPRSPNSQTGMYLLKNSDI